MTAVMTWYPDMPFLCDRTMDMKIYILLGHPDQDSFNGRIFDTYVLAANHAGHEVRTQQIGQMKFDPVLWKGYKVVQELEPDLKTAQENILWCDKWVIIYPVWWGSVPAVLKGFFDRTLYPGFAYKHHENDPFWDKLLKGRSADIITTSDSPIWWIWWQYRNSDLRTVKTATLQYCGVKPVRVLRITRLRYQSESKRLVILKAVAKFVKRI